MHLNFNVYILIVMFLVSLTSFMEKPSPFYLKLFPFYFSSSLIAELAEDYMAEHHMYNTGIFNIYGTIEFCFYFFVFREIIVNTKAKSVIKYVLFLYPLLCMIILFFQKKVGFNSINYTTGSIITVVFSIYYFAELFQKAEIQSLARLPAFWIATGIFFSTVCTFPMYTLISFMKSVPKIIVNNIYFIFYFISLLSSILYSIGFLCRIRIRKSTL